MTIDPNEVMAFEIPPYIGCYDERVAVLYALGLGLGHDPVDRDVLPFVYEDWGPKVLPTLSTVIGDPNHWLSDPGLGIRDYPNVHGDQTITLHAPLPTKGEISSQNRIVGLYDRGPGSHGILIIEEEMSDTGTGKPLVTLRQTDVLIGAGGFGGEPPPAIERPPMPDRPADFRITHPTAPQAALLYRLSGDYYELHVESDVARAAGFDSPILHGFATYGIACHGIVAACCDHEPQRIARFHGRFTAPVYPGDVLSTSMWRDGSVVWFETRVDARDVIVLGNGRADLNG